MTSAAHATMSAMASPMLLVKVARGLYRRWETLAAADRDRLRHLAERAKDAAFDLRGRTDRAAAEAELTRASAELAGAISDCAEADPDVTREELDALRSDLARELERVARTRRAA